LVAALAVDIPKTRWKFEWRCEWEDLAITEELISKCHSSRKGIPTLHLLLLLMIKWVLKILA
jgi:hypothetical protein